jgi:AMP phosphorylase
MNLRIKPLGFSSGGPFVSILNRKDADSLDLHPGDRIEIKSGAKEIVSVIDVTKNEKSVRKGEIGFFDEIINVLSRKKGEVHIHLSKRLKSVAYIKKKLGGEILEKEEIGEIVHDIVDNNLNEVELAYFVSACYSNKLSIPETINLTKAIVENGNQLNLKKHPVFDKHCTGGVPGNRTTMIIVPILSAAGLTIPKTSSRAISSAAGTSDTVEVLARVEFPIEKLKQIVRKTNACMVWGGGLNLASADDKLIKVRYPLGLDPEGLLISSIMAKKKAVNATHVLIDIPIGKDTKITSIKQARVLKRKFIKVGKKLKMNIKVLFTDGSQPIGNGIGPALEARDVLEVLMNRGPKDLRDKSVEMAGIMFGMAGIRNGQEKAFEILRSGKAYAQMKKIIKMQGGNPNITPGKIQVGKHQHVLRAKKSGRISKIDNHIISKIARIAGAPADKGAGVYLWVHTNDIVKKGDKLLTIHSESNARLNDSIQVSESKDAFEIVHLPDFLSSISSLEYHFMPPFKERKSSFMH